MALSAPTHLAYATDQSSAGVNSKAFASVSPPSDCLLIISGTADSANNTADNVSSVSTTLSNVGTWTFYEQQASAPYAACRTFIGWAKVTGAPGSGTVTVNWAGLPQDAIAMELLYVPVGFDLSTPILHNDLFGFGQVEPASGTLANTPASTSLIIVAYGQGRDGPSGFGTITPGSGFTELGQADIHNTTWNFDQQLETQYRLTGTGTAVSVSALNTTGGNNGSGAMVAIEIKEASSGTNAPAGNAAGTGAANAAGKTVAPNAGAAAGTGAANLASTKVSPTGGVATGTGAALAASTKVSPTAGAAAGTGSAGQASVTTSSGTNAPAGVATGTGAAAAPAASVASTSGLASGTGSAGAATTKAAPVAGVAAGTGSALAGSVPVGYFSDDFPGTSIDSTKWEVYNRLGDQVNSEVNAVIPANVRVGGGSSLYIDSKFETVSAGDTTTGPPNPRNVDYTSGQIAQKSAPILYGDIRVRAKIPGGDGTWPCIWMLGYEWQASQPYTANVAGANWPNAGWWEIDIAEFLGGHRTLVNNALHFVTANRGGSGEKIIPFDATTRFMVYRLVWTATSLTWYVDAEDGNGWVQTLAMTGTAGTDIPDTPGYLIIHTAIGGVGGTPNSGTYPVTFEVDYVQVNPLSTITASAAQGLGAAGGAKATVAPVAGAAAGTGLALAATTKVAPVAGVATGTGAANVASVTTSGNTNAPGGVAAGVGAANAASVTLLASSGVATGVGASRQAAASAGPTAGTATGVGAAYTTAASVAPVAGAAAGVGVANVASVTTSGNTNAPGGAAAGIGTANQAAASIQVPAGAAAGVGSALLASATTSSSTNAPGGVAAGTGLARDATTKVSVTAGAAAGVGSAYVAAVVLGVIAPGGVAAGTGTAYQAHGSLTTTAGAATGTGVAYPGSGPGTTGVGHVRIYNPTAGGGRIYDPVPAGTVRYS